MEITCTDGKMRIRKTNLGGWSEEELRTVDHPDQAFNVYRMKLLGAKVHAVTSGTATLKDAVSETMREWTNRIADTHYVLGSAMGPHPFPTIVRDFQAVISKEIKEQMLEKEGRLPDVVMACVGVGPEHAHLYDLGRAKYVPVTDDEAVDAFEYLSRIEGIIPAIESAHAVAYAKKIVPQMDKDEIVVITLSGRGDKDCVAIARYRGENIHE